jgi:hypothetical protein
VSVVRNPKRRRSTVPPIEAYLNLPAFLTIVSSSVEVFKKETIGYLIGIKGEHKFIVEYAIPYQTAESGFAHATIDLARVARINEILSRVSEGLEFIGDFHSHTMFGDNRGTVNPSLSDLQSTVPGQLNNLRGESQATRRTLVRESPWHPYRDDR